MFDKHPIFVGSATQNIIALSRGEPECYSAVRGKCRLFGMMLPLKSLDSEVLAKMVFDSHESEDFALR